jgi:hypothetical protein
VARKDEKPDPSAKIKETLDKTEDKIKKAGVSGDEVVDALKKMFDERTRD